MLTKRLQVAILSLLIPHILLSVYYSILMPWGGDEWYTYNQWTIMAVPNTLLVSTLKTILGPVSVHNYLFYR